MSDEHKNNPMHGVKLVQVLEELEAHYGWEMLGTFVNINCFNLSNSNLKLKKMFQRVQCDFICRTHGV